MRALLKTVPGLPHDELASVLAAMWPLVDHDNSGQIDRAEFMAPGGLLELLCANLRPRASLHPHHNVPASSRAAGDMPTPMEYPSARSSARRQTGLRATLMPWITCLSLTPDQFLAFKVGVAFGLALLAVMQSSR